MMWNSFRYVLLILCGASFGLLAAAGVFTVFAAVGLIPRFAGKTHTARHVLLYEELVIAGTVVGGFVSIFERYCHLDALFTLLGLSQAVARGVETALMVCIGLFAGMFVGCLALAIAEMLDSIPIFSRRVGFRHGLGVAVCAMAAGKLIGSLLYFWLGVHEWV